MKTKIEVTYNHLGHGPRVTTWGEKPVLVYWNSIIDGKETMVYSAELNGGYWYQQSRQWFNNWVVRVYEWHNGNLKEIYTDNFNPYGKRVHFHLENSSIEEHREYVKACFDFIEHWNLESYAIETKHAHELLKEFPGTSLSHKILDEICYVNFEIKKTPSSSYSWERYKMWSMNDEYVYFNHNHPQNPNIQSSYDFARSILFGPNYNSLDEWIPYAWTLNERVVS